MPHLLITGPAKEDVQSAHDWWAEHRSVEQAARWYLGIYAAIESLRIIPERCSFATEHDLCNSSTAWDAAPRIEFCLALRAKQSSSFEFVTRRRTR